MPSRSKRSARRTTSWSRSSDEYSLRSTAVDVTMYIRMHAEFTCLLRFFTVVFLVDTFAKLPESLAVLADNLFHVGLKEEGKRLSRHVATVPTSRHVMRRGRKLAVGKNLQSFASLERCKNI